MPGTDGERHALAPEYGRRGTLVHYRSNRSGCCGWEVNLLGEAARGLREAEGHVTPANVRTKDASELSDTLGRVAVFPGWPVLQLMDADAATWGPVRWNIEVADRGTSAFGDLRTTLVLDAKGNVVDAWLGADNADAISTRILAALRRDRSD
jgi:hypothetical protein